MIRQIIHINTERCNGCGLCAQACHESAIGIINGKAVLLRDDYCDGLGNCLPVCPKGAISFVEREAAEYDEGAVKANQIKKMQEQLKAFGEGCPGSQARTIYHNHASTLHDYASVNESQLSQWPVQIKLAPVNAPYLNGARLLVAADCSAYAYANFHRDFIKGRITLIGCPKLDNIDYSEKLTEIIRSNDIKEITIVRMEVPCCGGLEHAVKTAMQASGKYIPWSVKTISTDGRILD